MFKKLSKNFSKPQGVLGAFLVNSMNKGHESLTKWALSLVDIKPENVVLDIGCGGGNAVSLMSKNSNLVYGADYSEVSVKKTKKKNADAVKRGAVKVELCSVSNLPFPGGMFDLATAFETIYFWPDLPGDFREVFRVLKPGGLFMPVFQNAHDPEKAKQLEGTIPGMKVPDPAQVESFLRAAGFSQVSVHNHPGSTWIDIAIIAQKP